MKAFIVCFFGLTAAILLYFNSKGAIQEVLFIAAVIQAAFLLIQLPQILAKKSWYADLKKSGYLALAAPLLNFHKLLIFGLALMFLLNHWGYSIQSLLAGLGIGGLALAFGSQEIISNFFGSISLLIDGSFEIGDEIKVKEMRGKVLAIGFRSTKIRNEEGHEITVPNKLIASEILENFSRKI